jgi:hypothetical protein
MMLRMPNTVPFPALRQGMDGVFAGAWLRPCAWSIGRKGCYQRSMRSHHLTAFKYQAMYQLAP